MDFFAHDEQASKPHPTVATGAQPAAAADQAVALRRAADDLLAVASTLRARADTRLADAKELRSRATDALTALNG